MLVAPLALTAKCAQGDGEADALVLGGKLQLGFIVEKAPALAEAWDLARENPGELPPPGAILLPQLACPPSPCTSMT